ncbi:hypothetical protein [Chryseobacterium caseinilyticum]|uniref:Uncharacterized protein n=1 Tax=Chryseobacterium caseinilyticum TaxID=2771428 RepID=A0ABR8ZBN7_9FLAO|nr:hypothetical protein [Chryseobacterium caseinilyticum]MBD8082499.1 hypothetical protein [Chryseobacterium caseinilyticum]
MQNKDISLVPEIHTLYHKPSSVNTQTSSPQNFPAAEKPQSQKEEKGIVDSVRDWWNNLELWDWKKPIR